MIGAIAELGRYEKQKNDSVSAFDIWLEDSYDGGKYDILFLIQFEKMENTWCYTGVDVRENSSTLKSQLLYKRGSSRGTDKTPTAKTAKSMDGTFLQKIKGWFESNITAPYIGEEESGFLKSIHDELNKKTDGILADLKEKAEQIEAKGIVLSLLFFEDNSSKFIGDYPFFSSFIVEESKGAYKFSKTFKKESYAKNEICSVCNRKKDEVYGFFTSLGFYTVDKPGMVSGGFRQDESWKNYPVCLDCALDIELGIKVKEAHLDFSLYGLRYYLIPKIINENEKDVILDLILTYNSQPKVNDQKKDTITGSEEELFELLVDEKNNAFFNLVFYDKPQKGVFRILSSVEEVLPSRLKYLFEIKDVVDQIFIFSLPEKDGKKIFRFNFGAIRTFFPNDRIRGNHNKAFLQIVQNIFNGAPVKYGYILNHIMKHLRGLFAEDQNYWFQTLQGFMLLVYLNSLGILHSKNGAQTMEQTFFKSFTINSKEEFDQKVLGFFDQFQGFFETYTHKGIFLTGVLTQFLLNIQKEERNATPFRSRLKGLKMNSSDMVALLPMIIEKLEQYGKNYYPALEKLISKCFLSAGDHNKWNLSIDEMNYVFVLGMNLADYFKIKSEKKESNTEE